MEPQQYEEIPGVDQQVLKADRFGRRPWTPKRGDAVMRLIDAGIPRQTLADIAGVTQDAIGQVYRRARYDKTGVDPDG